MCMDYSESMYLVSDLIYEDCMYSAQLDVADQDAKWEKDLKEAREERLASKEQEKE